MQNKLAGLLSVMAFMLLAGTWCFRRLFALPVMDPVQVLSVVLIVLPVYYFIIGRIVARVGVAIIQEEIIEQRSKEEEYRHQTKMLQQDMVENDNVKEEGEDTKAEEKSEEPDV